MTTLELYCLKSGIKPINAMNLLQGAGIISDNAVNLSDVADADHERAINWLALRWGEEK